MKFNLYLKHLTFLVHMVQMWVKADNLFVCTLQKHITLTEHKGILDLYQTSRSFHTHSLNCGRSMSMMAYIRRGIITSPGCQNDPLAEMGACGAVMTYGSPQIVLLSSCSRGHCGVTVGACVVWTNSVEFLCYQETLYHTSHSQN